jgi:hypothetical protein
MPVLRSSGVFLVCMMVVCRSVLFYATSYGQDAIRSFTIPIADSVHLSSLSFERELNTYVWNGNIQKELHSQIWSADIHQQVRSRLIKTSQIAIQDEYRGLISLRARLSENWNLQIKDTSNVLSDNRAIDLNRMAQHQFLAGFEYLPTRNIAGELFGGYEMNSQIEERDNGFVCALGLDAHKIKLEEFDVSFNSSWNQSFLGRRSPNTGNMKIVLLRDFGSGVDDSLTVTYDTQRREFYTALSPISQTVLGVRHNIFQRDARVIEIINQISYDIDRGLSLVILAGLSNRLIDRGYRFKDYINTASLTLDSHIQEMQFFGTISLKLSVFEWLEANTKLSYTEREERHSVQEDVQAPISIIESQQASASRLANTAERTTLALGLTANASQYSRISLLSSTSILRYDTPDSLNTDDRDELLITSGIEIVHRFSQHLTLTVNGDATLSHLVYLHRTQSANNNWNRVIRLSPSIEYMPTSWFRTVARTEVLANYTVSDYEQQVASIKSFSFRQALWSDSAIVQLSRKIQCNFYGSLRIFERGTFRWKEFSEKPEDYFIEKTIWPEFVWSSDIGLKVGIGYRYFGQDRYIYQNGKKLFFQGIEAMGPTAFIEWLGFGSEKVTLKGWREEQKNNGATTAIFSNLSVQVGFIL